MANKKVRLGDKPAPAQPTAACVSPPEREAHVYGAARSSAARRSPPAKPSRSSPPRRQAEDEKAKLQRHWTELLPSPLRAKTSVQDAREAMRPDTFSQVLAEHGGNVSHAAIALRLSRVALQKKMKIYGLR